MSGHATRPSTAIGRAFDATHVSTQQEQTKAVLYSTYCTIGGGVLVGVFFSGERGPLARVLSL